MGKHGLLHADQKHRIEFQSFGRVKRHQGHGFGIGVQAVNVGNQRHLFQKRRKGRGFGFGLELPHSRQQFAQVLQP